MMKFGEFSELILMIPDYLLLGCAVVEAPKKDNGEYDEATLDKLLGSTLFFIDYYKEYFEKYKADNGENMVY
jgi:hypothetical protein